MISEVQRELDFKSLSTDRKRELRRKEKLKQSLGEDNPCSLIRDVSKARATKNGRNYMN
jgi:hypothetical protein